MAEITDKFGKASADNTYAQATTVRVARAAGESVLAAFDLSKFNDTRPVFFVTYKKTTDPEDPDKVITTNQTGWKALVNADNNTLTNLTLAPGYTDVGNEVGDYIELMPTSFWVNELVDGLSQTINPDGTPKDTRFLQYTDELLADSIVSGTGVVTTVAGREIAISNMTYYMSGIRLTKTGIPNKTLTATKDTYGYIDTTGNVSYVEVAVGATPTAPANSIPFVKATTNATTVTSITLMSRGAVTSSQLDLGITTDANGWKVYDFGTFKEYTKQTSYVEIDAGTEGSLDTSNFPAGVTQAEILNGTAILTYSIHTADARAWAGRIRSSAKLTASSILIGITNQGTSGQWWAGRGHVVIRK